MDLWILKLDTNFVKYNAKRKLVSANPLKSGFVRIPGSFNIIRKRPTSTYLYIYIYLSIYIYMCVCVAFILLHSVAKDYFMAVLNQEYSAP